MLYLSLYITHTHATTEATTPQTQFYKWMAQDILEPSNTYSGIGYGSEFEICKLAPGSYDINFQSCVYANNKDNEHCAPPSKAHSAIVAAEIDKDGKKKPQTHSHSFPTK